MRLNKNSLYGKTDVAIYDETTWDELVRRVEGAEARYGYPRQSAEDREIANAVLKWEIRQG